MNLLLHGVNWAWLAQLLNLKRPYNGKYGTVALSECLKTNGAVVIDYVYDP